MQKLLFSVIYILLKSSFSVTNQEEYTMLLPIKFCLEVETKNFAKKVIWEVVETMMNDF